MRFGIREFIFFAILFAVPVASYFYLFKPKNEEIAQARAEIDIKLARLNTLSEVVSKIDDIGLAIESGREAIELIEAKLPSEQDVEGILQQVWRTADRNELVVRSVKSEPPVPAALYMELPLRVVMEGHFDGFYQFLLELEKLPRITRIHNLDLKRAGTDMRPARGETAPKEVPPGWTRAEFLLSIYFESPKDNGE